MANLTLFVGLDVHKKTISVAMVAAAGAEVRFYRTIAHTPDIIRALCRKLSRDRQQPHFCYDHPYFFCQGAARSDPPLPAAAQGVLAHPKFS
jgi:hypothetical protein